MKAGQVNIDTNNMDNIAEHYLQKYKGYVEMHESMCSKSRAGISVSSADIVAFGKTLDMWESYHRFCESNNTLAALGPMPTIALDVVAAVQTKNILPLIASQQPIDELQGIVYAKKLVAAKGTNSNNSGMGSVVPGQTLNSTMHGGRVNDGAFGAGRIQFNATSPFVTTASGGTTYTVQTGVHLLPETVRLTLVDATASKQYVWMDDGTGQLLGNLDNSGTVDYETGAITLNFGTAPTDGLNVVGSCHVDVEAEPDMVTISTGYDPISIQAEFFGLKTEMGMLNNFSFQKRWGRSSADEQAQDLADELTNVMNAAGCQRLIESFSGGSANTTEYTRTAPTGVSLAEHKLSFIDAHAGAEGVLNKRAGRGVINRYIVGTTGAATLRAMPGFEAAAGGSMQQVGLYGTLDGIPVIRVTDDIANTNRGTGTDDDIYGIYMGAGAFDTPLVQATYLPIFVTGTMNFGNNPLNTHQAIGTMTGLKAVMDRYVTRITLK